MVNATDHHDTPQLLLSLALACFPYPLPTAHYPLGPASESESAVACGLLLGAARAGLAMER